MTQKTAIDTLIDDLLSGKITEVLSNKERYKEIENQQIVDTYKYALPANMSEAQKQDEAEFYYNEKYRNSPSPSK